MRLIYDEVSIGFGNLRLISGYEINSYRKVLCITHTFFSKNLIKSGRCELCIGTKLHPNFSDRT